MLESVPLIEVGARNSKSDQQIIQTMHDHAVALGACCAEPDTDDVMESLIAAGLYLPDALRLMERNIPQAEREKMDAGDFAGKGKSFPIKTQQDFEAALHSIGRAGPENYSHDELHSRIIAIGKRKGFKLPNSAGKESAIVEFQSGLRLIESAATTEAIILRESRADYEIKLIAPGKGSSAFYPAEVLRRDGPQVFRAGTHVYLNHPTAAEEAARPEGSVDNLAGVLTTDAVYHESHAKGEGLYGRMKVFADHAQAVEEKAPYVGMSIRAAGVAESGKKQDGLPVLKQLTSAESVDVVTRAGAGGMILTEAARPAPTQEEGSQMDAAEIKRLVEAETAPLRERLIRADAREQGALLLEGVSLPVAAKMRVIESVLDKPLPRTDVGDLDKTKFSEAIGAAAQAEGRYLAGILGSGQVRGMGVAAPDPIKITEARKAHQAEVVELNEAAENVFGRLMGDPAAAKAAARKGEAA